MCVYMCQLHSMVWNDRDLPAQQEAAECGALGDPNRGPDITVFLLGGKPNAGPISNLVFHQIWQLESDDKLSEILFPPGNLWQYSCTHTTRELLSFFCTDWMHVTQLKAEKDVLDVLLLFGCRFRFHTCTKWEKEVSFCDIKRLD